MTPAVRIEDPTATANTKMYVPPDKTWDLKLRSRESFKALLLDVMRLWKMFAVKREDDVGQIDLAYVIRTLLETGAQQAFHAFGGRPKTEEDWKVIAQAIEDGVSKVDAKLPAKKSR